MGMIRVVILGQGMVASHLAVGIERIKQGEVEPYGVPLASIELPYKVEDIEIVRSYDVDESKVGKSLYKVCSKLLGNSTKIPSTLKDVYVSRGIHMGSMDGMPIKVKGLEDKVSIDDAITAMLDDFKSDNVDVIVNLITTEYGEPLNNVAKLRSSFTDGVKRQLTASQIYAYVASEYSRLYKSIAFVNGIPIPLANDQAYVDLYKEDGGVLLGDDGATGATPLTADLLEHLAERNRRVKFIVQFNIGGNTDFLALTLPKKNLMKELTKSSIVEDILGYDAPHYIKPTGYLKPLGDKKFVSMHIEYLSFNGFKDEIYVEARINDSPAMAGSVVDMIRMAKIAVDKGHKGTIYPVNVFFMKKPGPPRSKSIAKILAYYHLLKWLYDNGVITLSSLPETTREYIQTINFSG